MPITTSYFMLMTHIRHPISIAAKPPRWFKGPTYTKLAPPFPLLKDYKNGIIGLEEFRFRFEHTVLEKLDPYEVVKDLYKITNVAYGGDICLLSYEKPGIPSHRVFVAEYLSCALDYDIKELNLRDCLKDKYFAEHMDLYKTQLNGKVGRGNIFEQTRLY